MSGQHHRLTHHEVHSARTVPANWPAHTTSLKENVQPQEQVLDVGAKWKCETCRWKGNWVFLAAPIKGLSMVQSNTGSHKVAAYVGSLSG